MQFLVFYKIYMKNFYNLDVCMQIKTYFCIFEMKNLFFQISKKN